jgi:hypothetical protein
MKTFFSLTLFHMQNNAWKIVQNLLIRNVFIPFSVCAPPTFIHCLLLICISFTARPFALVGLFYPKAHEGLFDFNGVALGPEAPTCFS